MKKILSIMYVIVMLVKTQYKASSLLFAVPYSQINGTSRVIFPSFTLVKLRLHACFWRSVCSVIVYPFFRTYQLNTKKVYLSSSKSKRVILWILLYFFVLKRLTLRKSTSIESSSEFLDSKIMKTPASIH